MALAQREVNQALKINRMLEQWPATLDQNVRRAIQEQEKLLAAALQRLASVLPAVGSKIPNQWVRVDKPPPILTIDLAPLLSFAERTNINRISEQWADTIDQNVRRAIQEQEKLLAAALQRLASVLPAVGSKIPNQWVRVDIPPLIQNVDLAPLLSFAERIQKGLPQINYKGISSISLSTLTHPPRNSIVAFPPYADCACGINSQYTDNEEEPSDSTTDSKSGVEHSGWYYNCQWLLGQGGIAVEASLTLGIRIRISILSLLEGCAQRWETVVWIVMAIVDANG